MSSFDQLPYGFSEPAQNPFATDEFADNPEQRCPCVLVLDTSGSMQGKPIAELNAGLAAFKQAVMQDSLAMKRLEIAIVTFGPVQVMQNFVTADQFQPPNLDVTGDTPMGAAITDAIHLVEMRKDKYRQHGVAYNRPWIFLITDGAPTDDVSQATRLLRAGVDQKKFAFFAVGVEGANMLKLGQISPRQPLKLQGLMFRELFQWLSSSLGSASRSAPNTDQLALPPPTGWAIL